MESIEGCTLCEVHSKEFAHDPCPIINNRSGYCPCDELGRLDGQIRDFLHQALKKRQELRSRVNHFHDRLHQMPPEVVSSIFLFYVSSVPKKIPGPPPWHSPPSRQKSSGPLILGAVCQKWREIAWSTPQLWSSISLYLSPKSFSSNLRIAQEWLSRSGQLPLSISLFMRNFSISTDDLLPITHLFNKYAGRWQHLEFLSIPHSILSKLKPNGLSLHGPTTLHTINIYFVDRDRWGGLSPIFQGLSPTVVELSFVPFPSMGICWSRVTRVYASGFSVGACIELIQHAPLLTDCKFVEVTSEQEEYLLPRGNTIQTSLNSLFVELVDSKIDTFLHHFSLPSLQELHLDYGACFNTPPTDALLAFCARSPLLKKLQLMGSVIEHDSELVRILSTTPALTHLYIVPRPIAGLTLRHLLTRLAESWLVGDDPCQAHEQFLPKLQCLHFSGHLSSDDLCEAFGPLSEITNPHRRPFNQLQFLWLNQHLNYNASMMKLISLKDAGINLKVTDPSVPDMDLLETYRSGYRQNFPKLL